MAASGACRVAAGRGRSGSDKERLREYSQLVHGLDGLDENVGGFAGSASDIQVARNPWELCELDESDGDFAAVVT